MPDHGALQHSALWITLEILEGLAAESIGELNNNYALKNLDLRSLWTILEAAILP